MRAALSTPGLRRGRIEIVAVRPPHNRSADQRRRRLHWRPARLCRRKVSMTPQERDLITTLLNRLKTAGAAGQQKDAEADALIRQAAREQPDITYYLVQTVLIQDLSLNQAQSRIAELEQQLAAAKSQTSSGTS